MYKSVRGESEKRGKRNDDFQRIPPRSGCKNIFAHTGVNPNRGKEAKTRPKRDADTSSTLTPKCGDASRKGEGRRGRLISLRPTEVKHIAGDECLTFAFRKELIDSRRCAYYIYIYVYILRYMVTRDSPSGPTNEVA